MLNYNKIKSDRLITYMVKVCFVSLINGSILVYKIFF